MKKIFTLIASAVIAMSANAALQTVAGYTVTNASVLAGDENIPNEGNGCSVQLHVSELKPNADNADIIGASLNTENKYIQIDLAEELQEGDFVNFSFFMGSNPLEDNTEGIKVSNAKVGAENYELLAVMYAQKADKKSVVTSSYIAKGGEKKFVVYRLASTTMFHAISVVRGYGKVLDFANPALTSVAACEGATMNRKELSLSENPEDNTQIIWKNTAGATASFDFVAAPVSVSYKNNSAKEFVKTGLSGGVPYFQFNSKSINMSVTCTPGEKITIYPISYSKDGSFTVTGAVETSLSLPKESTTPVSITANSSKVSFTLADGASRISKLEISSATAVQGVAEAKVAKTAPAKVLKNGQIFIDNYTVAGAQVK